MAASRNILVILALCAIVSGAAAAPTFVKGDYSIVRYGTCKSNGCQEATPSACRAWHPNAHFQELTQKFGNIADNYFPYPQASQYADKNFPGGCSLTDDTGAGVLAAVYNDVGVQYPNEVQCDAGEPVFTGSYGNPGQAVGPGSESSAINRKSTFVADPAPFVQFLKQGQYLLNMSLPPQWQHWGGGSPSAPWKGRHTPMTAEEMDAVKFKGCLCYKCPATAAPAPTPHAWVTSPFGRAYKGPEWGRDWTKEITPETCAGTSFVPIKSYKETHLPVPAFPSGSGSGSGSASGPLAPMPPPSTAAPKEEAVTPYSLVEELMEEIPTLFNKDKPTPDALVEESEPTTPVAHWGMQLCKMRCRPCGYSVKLLPPTPTKTDPVLGKKIDGVNSFDAQTGKALCSCTYPPNPAFFKLGSVPSAAHEKAGVSMVAMVVAIGLAAVQAWR
jgi:hypothetical protein